MKKPRRSAPGFSVKEFFVRLVQAKGALQKYQHLPQTDEWHENTSCPLS
jgi:hypothetical protein